MRIVHLSDVHVWKFTLNPLRLMNKRCVGMASLALGRARRFRLERLASVVERVQSLDPDHVLITGDLTTTALAEEFESAREALQPLLLDAGKATIIPGNHDRYTEESLRHRRFERAFGRHMGASAFPWLRFIADRTAVLGLDPTRPALSARGRLPREQLSAARDLWESHRSSIDRLIVACHYPIEAPPGMEGDLEWKRLEDAHELAGWLATIGPHLYCCGHVHHAWAFEPKAVPQQLCLNAGAPLLKDRAGDPPPGFLEIVLNGPNVNVEHHAWTSSGWHARPIALRTSFFARAQIEPGD